MLRRRPVKFHKLIDYQWLVLNRIIKKQNIKTDRENNTCVITVSTVHHTSALKRGIFAFCRLTTKRTVTTQAMG